MAARSESAPASARCPASAQPTWPRRKWTPSTMTSSEVTAAPVAATTAASSPGPRGTRAPRVAKLAVTASMSSSSRTARRSAGTVDDAGAVEVVGGELDPDAVARGDADAEALHPARDVPEHHVLVVQLDPEGGVWQGLPPLALELDRLGVGHGR